MMTLLKKIKNFFWEYRKELAIGFIVFLVANILFGFVAQLTRWFYLFHHTHLMETNGGFSLNEAFFTVFCFLMVCAAVLMYRSSD